VVSDGKDKEREEREWTLLCKQTSKGEWPLGDEAEGYGRNILMLY